MIEEGMKLRARMKMMSSDGMKMMNLNYIWCITMAGMMDLFGRVAPMAMEMKCAPRKLMSKYILM